MRINYWGDFSSLGVQNKVRVQKRWVHWALDLRKEHHVSLQTCVLYVFAPFDGFLLIGLQSYNSKILLIIAPWVVMSKMGTFNKTTRDISVWLNYRGYSFQPRKHPKILLPAFGGPVFSCFIKMLYWRALKIFMLKGKSLRHHLTLA